VALAFPERRTTGTNGKRAKLSKNLKSASETLRSTPAWLKTGGKLETTGAHLPCRRDVTELRTSQETWLRREMTVHVLQGHAGNSVLTVRNVIEMSL